RPMPRRAFGSRCTSSGVIFPARSGGSRWSGTVIVTVPCLISAIRLPHGCGAPPTARRTRFATESTPRARAFQEEAASAEQVGRRPPEHLGPIPREPAPERRRALGVEPFERVVDFLVARIAAARES